MNINLQIIKTSGINSKVLWSFQRFNGSHSTNKALGVTNIKKQKNKGNKEKIDNDA